MSIKNLPKHQRPREKLIELGVENLYTEELLAILLRTGNRIKTKNGKKISFSAVDLGKKILKKFNIEELGNIKIDDLKSITGISDAKATALLASFELSKRINNYKHNEGIIINSSEDAYKLTQSIHNSKKEKLMVLYLNTANKLIHQEIISIGLVDSTPIHPREIFYLL